MVYVLHNMYTSLQTCSTPNESGLALASIPSNPDAGRALPQLLRRERCGGVARAWGDGGFARLPCRRRGPRGGDEEDRGEGAQYRGLGQRSARFESRAACGAGVPLSGARLVVMEERYALPHRASPCRVLN